MDTLNEINPALAVAFSGHRPDRLPGHGDPDTPETQKLIATLREQIEDAIERGKIIYIQGAMTGFDILCGEQIILLKEKHPQIRLVTVAPYQERFFSREPCWTPDWIHRAREVFSRQDIGVKLSERYYPGVYYERNRTMIDHSSELICYHDGGKGGTAQTVRYAKGRGLPVYNLCLCK